MAEQIKYEQRLAGGRAVAQRNGAQVFDGIIDQGTVYSCKKGDYYYLTGYYYQVGYIQYIQTTTGLYVYVDYSNEGDWRVTQDAVKPTNYSVSAAQALVNKIISNNAAILCNNLLCARYANKLTAEQQSAVRTLQLRLQARNSALQAGGLTTNVHTSYPGGYAELSPYLDKFMNYEAIGVATWVVVVIAATVVAATATAAYYAYKSLADESERDIKYSKELTRVLTSKLTDEEYRQLVNETKGIVTKAKIKQSLSSYWDVIKWGAIAFAGYTLYEVIKNRFA